MMEAVDTLTVLMRDPACRHVVRGHPSFRLLRDANPDRVSAALNIFVLVTASTLEAVAPFIREANRTHHLRAFLLHADVDPLWVVQMLDVADLRTLRNLIVHKGPEVPARVLGAWRIGAQTQLIADASVVGDALMVISCAMERIEVPFAELPALGNLSREARSAFVIADDGSYLHWPEPDVHLDLEAIRVAVDPTAREAATRHRLQHDARFGMAVARVRSATGLRQEDVPGLSARQVRRIEAGALPRAATLEKLAAAHGLDLRGYLDAVAERVGDSRAASGPEDTA